MFAEFDLTQSHLWLVIGAGLLVFGLALVVGTRPWARDGELTPPPEEGTGKKDPFVQGSRSEKRGAFRRKGKCVEVELADENVEKQSWRGWVVDRSIRGLRVTV